MLADKVIQSVLSAADGNDFGAFVDEAVGHGRAYAGCCANHEDVFVLERHVADGLFSA